MLGLLLAVGAIFSQGIGSGTSVVVLRSPKMLFAAVDSKEIWREYRGGKSSVEERLSCKLAKVGPYYAIVAGIAHASGEFDALRAAREAYVDGDSMDRLAGRLRESLGVRVAGVLEAIGGADPEAFRTQYARRPALQLTLLGIERNEPRLLSLEFVAGNAPSELGFRSLACPGDCATGTSGYFFGTHERIDRFLERDTRFVGHTDEKHTAALLDLEYADRPDLVGGPITLLQLGKTGFTILQEGACAP